MAIKFEKETEGVYKLDCRGYVCPHPQIYTKKMLEKMHPGDVLEVIFDNPSSSESISAMCANQGDEVVEANFEAGRFIFKIRKKG